MHILGSNNKVVRHGPLRIWAERGLIRIEDSRDNSYQTENVKEFTLRLKALNDMVKNSQSTDRMMYYNEVLELQRVIDDCVEVIKIAQEQGMPDDASARRDLARRRPTSVFIPKQSDLDF